jgi:hypothetical protein
VYTPLVDDDTLGRVTASWIGPSGVVTNAGLLASFITAAGCIGRDPAAAIVEAVDTRRLSARLRRRNVADLPGFARLAAASWELGPRLVEEVFPSPEDAKRLLMGAPVRQLSGMIDGLLASHVIAAEDARDLLHVRFAEQARSQRVRDPNRLWLSVGWVARALWRHGAPIDLSVCAAGEIPAYLPPWTRLWAAAWTEPSSGVPAAVTALERLADAPAAPHEPWQAVATLAAVAELSRRGDAQWPPSAGDLMDWRHAMKASLPWMIALTEAVATSEWLSMQVRDDWGNGAMVILQSALEWKPHRWRPAPQQALRLLREAQQR